ncbi:MAG: helix-turn-helix transcriptional regulator [Lachnospiraceae bacterium]|nr:helix-turn-helix transcriptional regulator [Lachnospiraceae bacterium]
MIAENDVVTLDENQRISIGIRIQEQRMKCGMSGAMLGAYLGINSNQVSRIETGKAKCSLEHLFVIAQVLNCSADYLLFGKKQMPVLTQRQMDLIEQLHQSIAI